MIVTALGPFAGNFSNNGSTAPAHTAVIDYFFNRSSPIVPEDGGSVTPSYMLNLTATGQGSFDLNPPGGVYDDGTTVQITAVPAAGWEFTSWGGDLIGTANPTSVVMDGDKTVSATFSAISVPQYNLTVNTVGSGNVTLSPPGGVYDDGTTVQITAVAEAGWEFSGWGGDLTGAANPTSIVMDEDKAVIAIYDQSANPSGIVSDDFNHPNLDTVLWWVSDPLGDAGVTLTGAGTGDAQLLFSVPAGASHDPWATDTAPRLLQAANDTDFSVEVKFDSPLTERYQTQGIIVEQDLDTWLRFDFYTNGSVVYIFSASKTNGTMKRQIKQAINISEPMYLRVDRSGDLWTVFYSGDGANWTVAGSYTYPMIVSALGPFVGNFGDGSNAPAHTAVIDYFFNGASPIVPEDDGEVMDTIPPYIYQVTYDNAYTTLYVSWRTDEPATGFVEYGTTQDFELGYVGYSDFSVQHYVEIDGLQLDTTYYFRAVSDDVSENRAVSNSYTVTTPINIDMPEITVWYGHNQRFGDIGTPQRWINVLGNITNSSNVESVTYALNRGVAKSLSLGPDGRRLVNEGDFNVELSVDEILDGENTVEIRLFDIEGDETVEYVLLNYQEGTVWPQEYHIVWSDMLSVNDGPQIVDGLWTIGSNGIRTVQTGYDRLVAIGDITWDNYEVVVPITIHGVDSNYIWDPVVGLGIRWQGHTVDGKQPSVQYYPLGGFAFYSLHSTPRFELWDRNPYVYDTSGFQLTFGITYIFKYRVETIPGGSRYSLKVWEAGQQEPSEWLLIGEEGTEDLSSGSLLLVAHHFDASFGDITITPLP